MRPALVASDDVAEVFATTPEAVNDAPRTIIQAIPGLAAKAL
jgi:hypothetical protein